MISSDDDGSSEDYVTYPEPDLMRNEFYNTRDGTEKEDHSEKLRKNLMRYKDKHLKSDDETRLIIEGMKSKSLNKENDEKKDDASTGSSQNIAVMAINHSNSAERT